MTTVVFELYGTDGCHLCELAEQLLAEVVQLAATRPAVMLVDIIDDERLVEAYGTTIPVIKNTQSGNEMNWPFDAAQLVDFFNR
jgi:hypothetical protein